jgi:FMN-dependent oxidoreductase (nitrilotriacetate monooxygenase family)
MFDKKHIVIGGLFEANGYQPSAWQAEGATDNAPTDIEYFRNIIQIAEAGKLDFFFMADTPAARTTDVDKWSRGPLYMNYMEPITTLAALATHTKHIGLGATASTTFYEPYNIARLFAALDHISHGRAAWNVVTTANDFAARNFGLDKLPPHDKRYGQARESLSVVKKLWDTWDDDAFIWDRQNVRQFDPLKFHILDHQGEYFKLYGGLNVARPPQGHPVIFQAGASETGKQFAAETAEVVFGTGANKAAAKAFYDDLKGRMSSFGREKDELKVLSGISLVVASSEAEAREKWEEWQSLIHPDIQLLYIKTDLETDLSDLPLDEPVPLDRIPAKSNHHQVYFDEIAGLIRQGLTLREVCRRYNRSKEVFLGTPSQVADLMEDWVGSGASDGFMVAFPVLPYCLTSMVDGVIPELQRRGLFRTDYTGKTLRENLRLKRPDSVHSPAR